LNQRRSRRFLRAASVQALQAIRVSSGELPRPVDVGGGKYKERPCCWLLEPADDFS